MTTRHTISHADELYAGDAFLGGDSPDGRRGLPITHIYVREYGAVAALDNDGIMSASAAPSDVIATFAVGQNLLDSTLCTGALALVTANATVITLDVPRNITYLCTTAGSGKPLIIEGRDEYNQTMVERITPTADDAYSSGLKAFKYIDKMYTTAACTVGMCIGTGKRLGLPYHLSSKGRFLAYYVDGMTPSGGATEVVLVTGLELSTEASSSENNPDVRGTFNPVIAPNGTLVFSAMMVVDHTTRNKAYGVPQAAALT